MDKKRTELHQFRKEPSYDGDVCPCQVWSVFKLESGNKNLDGQTDVGHINLIGGLVTRKPPN